MSDIRLPLREATVWPDRIATTGHCQRHHAGPRIRQHLYDHQGVVGGEEVFCVGPNNSSPFATGATLNVKGQRFLPGDGQEISPLVATSSPQWRPVDLPEGLR